MDFFLHTDGSDYVSEVELLTFNTDNSNFSISLPLINDDVFELTERLQAVLMFADDVPPERASVDLEMASVVIFDDDSKSIISYMKWIFGIIEP